MMAIPCPGRMDANQEAHGLVPVGSVVGSPVNASIRHGVLFQVDFDSFSLLAKLNKLVPRF